MGFQSRPDSVQAKQCNICLPLVAVARVLCGSWLVVKDVNKKSGLLFPSILLLEPPKSLQREAQGIAWEVWQCWDLATEKIYYAGARPIPAQRSLMTNIYAISQHGLFCKQKYVLNWRGELTKE